MGNIRWFTLKKKITADDLSKAIDLINRQNFSGIFFVTNVSTSAEGGWFSFDVDDPSGKKTDHAFDLGFEGPSLRKIGGVSPIAPWRMWLFEEMIEHLAQHLGGRLKDEGVPDPAADPKPKRHLTLESWIRNVECRRTLESYPEIGESIVKDILDHSIDRVKSLKIV